jgi:hypothetical protein
MLSSNWLLILVVIVLLVLGTALFLYVVLKRARKISFSPDPNAKPETAKKKSPPLEFLQYASDIELRSAFRRAIRILKTHVTGRDFRYQVPWYLMAGEADSGKTTLLDSSSINLAVSELVREDRQLNWFFFNEALVIDAAGDFVLRADGTANHRGWNTISRLLQKHRPQRPLDGLVLTIPATDLVGSNDLSHERSRRLEEKATCLYQKLWQAQKILGMCLPVYVLVTKCDEVTGFASFSNQLPERLQTQMLGWSNPCTLETAYNPDLLPEAFESLHKYISRLQFEIYTERDEIQNADDLFLFPWAMQSMRAPLQVYLDYLFKQSAYHESYFFRGIYFCGDGGTESSLDLPAPSELAVGWADTVGRCDASLPQEIVTRDRKPIFLFDLFKEKIFCEAALAQPIRSTALSRNRLVLAAQALSLAILVIGGLGLAISYRGLAHREADLYEFLANEKTDLEKVESSNRKIHHQPADISYRQAVDRGTADTTLAKFNHPPGGFDQPATLAGLSDAEWTDLNEPTLRNGEARLLAGMAKTNWNMFYSVFMPSSWFSGINERLENSIAGAFKYIIFESLRSDLERRGNRLLGNTADYSLSLNANSNYRQSDLPRRYNLIDRGFQAGSPLGVADQSIPSLDQNFQLHLYVEELGELRVNLERYDRLIRKDYSSFDDLRQLVKYLEHAPLPDGFDKENELYKRALRTAEGRPIETQQFYKKSASRTAEIVEDIYEGSFAQRGVKYDYLNDLAETEALLSRPEYTWLSSYVFEPHSPFHGMALSSALHLLQQGLQDLRHEKFSGRGTAYEGGTLPAAETSRYQHVVRRVLVWDQETLRQALAAYDQYQTFVETRSYEPSEDLDNSVKQVARTRVKTRISRLLSQARRYQPLAPAVEGSVLKASLIEEVRSLHDAQEPLSQVLQVSARLGIDREVRRALSDQAAYLLRGIHREFVSQSFYVAKRPGFSWWDGKQPVKSYLAYDLGSAEDLATYLNLQRKGIAFLGRDLAVPVMTFFASQNIYVPRGGSQVDWDEILTDLDAFDNKSPGNPISALENFIRVDMDQVSLESCSKRAQWSDERSSDYFLRIRNALRFEFYERCMELARLKTRDDTLAALQNYREIEESFNKNLARGFPFSYLGDQTTFPELDPWAMLKFFPVLKEKEKAAREALDRNAALNWGADYGVSPQRATEFEDQISRAREFMEQADKVREFFTPFLEKKQGPAFDFKVQLRVVPDREQEIGGEQIIDWKLEVGKKKFSYLSDDLTGHWIFGDPIRLSLRWANDSPSRPVASAVPLPFTVKDRTAVFEYNDSWSLFTFLLRHGPLLQRAGAQRECDQGFEADPYALKFTIKTEPDPAELPSQRPDLKLSPAKVFLRMSLVTANKQEPLMLPCFPTAAPATPSLSPNSRYKDD